MIRLLRVVAQDPARNRKVNKFVRILLTCLLGGFCLGLVPEAVQATQRPFIVSISAEAPAVKTGPDRYTVKTGSEVFITVHLTNTSKKNLAFGYDADSRTGVGFAHVYEIRDSRGDRVQKRAIMHPEIGSTGHGWPARVLKPGESMEIGGDHISLLYDLSRPGEYIVQLSRAINDDPKNGFVKSNTITLIIAK
jgi:hypothetical protein